VYRVARPELPEDLDVYVDSLDEQGRVTYISGHFIYRKVSLNFSAIGMEGYGGPNIAATLSEDIIKELRRLGLDDSGIEDLLTSLQRKIMEGQAHIQLKSNVNKTETQADVRKADST